MTYGEIARRLAGERGLSEISAHADPVNSVNKKEE